MSETSTGYDWRVILCIAAFWIGGLVLSYVLARRLVQAIGNKESGTDNG